jgi:hypothetical protein
MRLSGFTLPCYLFGIIPVVGSTSGFMWAVSICLIALLRSISAVVDIVEDVYYYYYYY